MIGARCALRRLTVCQLTPESRGNGGGLRRGCGFASGRLLGATGPRMESYNWKAKPISPCFGALLLGKGDFVAHSGVLRLDIRCRRSSCRYSSRERERQSGCPQGWGESALRRWLSVRHVQSPQTLRFLAVNMSQAYEPSCDHQHTWVSSSRATIPAGTELEKERSPC